ncbi:MAG TPA: glycosyl hydrolase, partial [Anaerolineales bacterium]
MNKNLLVFLTVLAFLYPLGAAYPVPVKGSLGKIGAPPPGTMYHGVYPGGVTGAEDDITLDGLHAYEQAAGKNAAWVYFSDNWFNGRAFPLATATWIRNAASIPYLRLMLRSDAEESHAEPVFTLDRIIAGDFDSDLLAWALAARDFGTPLILEYGPEMNGEWFSWNGIWNGAGNLTGYGDPTLPDGPERFRDAYRHIIQIFRQAGASNVTWVFHVNNEDIPNEPWNQLEQYYPGDAWIDWIGVSDYGALTPLDTDWPIFRDQMDRVYPRLVALAPDKPIIVSEFGVTSGNPLGDQAAWAQSALSDLIAHRWPRLAGFSWWNETWQNDNEPANDTDMRVQDNPALAAVFQKLIDPNPQILSRIIPPGSKML